MIEGNVIGEIQVKSGAKNDIGEKVLTWSTVQTLFGFLDLSSGDSKYSTYDAKIQESTHIFICDYIPINSKINNENSRMLINDKTYDVMLIDNPMELNKQLEIYLKYTGAQNG